MHPQLLAFQTDLPIEVDFLHLLNDTLPNLESLEIRGYSHYYCTEYARQNIVHFKNVKIFLLIYKNIDDVQNEHIPFVFDCLESFEYIHGIISGIWEQSGTIYCDK